MARGQRNPGAREIRRQSLDHGKRPQGTTKRRPQTPIRRSKRLEAKKHLNQRVDNERQIAQENPGPSPSKSNTRRLGPQTLSTRGKSSPLDQSRSHKRKLSEGTADLIAQTNHPPSDLPRKTFTKENKEDHQLASSSSTGGSYEQLSGKQKKRVISSQPHLEEVASRQSKRDEADGSSYDPVAYWTRTLYWPKEFMQRGIEMLEKRPSKRKTKSTHHSQTVERMKAHGIFMNSSNSLQTASKNLCNSYLQQDSQIIKSSIFSFTQFSEVLERVQDVNEARIQRDVTPWVVPSAENLIICGELKNDYIGEELSAVWTRCAPMGSTRPKPDYTAGLIPTTFTSDEVSKLENYAQPTKPFRFTARICFPFLMCEAKSGESGLGTADRQNIHSASIAVKAIFTLYREAFGATSPRVHQLYGQVLVFSVSHDHDRVTLVGHFATAEPDFTDGLKFHRHPLAVFSLSIGDGADRYRAYNFVRNIYEKFAPVHRERIKDAVAQLPKPAERTGLMFGVSEMSLDELDSQLDSQELLLLQGDDDNDKTFRKPGIPASSLRKVMRLRERMERDKKESDNRIDRLLQQLELQRAQMERQSKESKEQMEQQNKASREQMERQKKADREQMEQQIKADREQMDRQREASREQMEKQRKESKEQLDQQGERIKELIDLLRARVTGKE